MKQNKINSLTQREVIKIKTQRSETKENKLIQREVIRKENLNEVKQKKINSLKEK